VCSPVRIIAVLRDLSLKLKLPLVLSTALAVVILVLSAAAYREVHRAQLGAASERLLRVSQQWATLAQASMTAREEEVRQLALSTEAPRLIAAPDDPALRRSAEEVLERAVESDVVVTVEIIAPDGSLLVAAGDTALRPASARPAPRADGPVGPLVVWNGQLMYSVASVLTPEVDDPGTIVLWRAVQPIAVSAQLGDLIGEDLRVLYGTPGKGWTELTGIAEEPALDFAAAEVATGELVRYARAPKAVAAEGVTNQVASLGGVYAVARDLTPAPWYVVVELPEVAVLAGARAFLLRLLVLTPLALLSVAVVGWMVGSRVAHSVKETAVAAGAVAAGEVGRRVQVRGTDEIGDLATAFNAMAQQIEDSQVELENANARLGRSNADLENFAYVASHDLREPLRMIRSYTELLSERYKGRLDEEADSYLHFAADGAARMDALISALLAYSRLDGDQGEPVEVDAEEALGGVLLTLSTLIAETDAEVTHDPLPASWVQPGQLTPVLQNLLANALKFHNEGRPRVHVSARSEGDFNVYSVQDNGIGIAPEYSTRIFDVFRRLHGVAEFGGTGIGLSICKKVIERNGGRIWVESTPGEGSTFYFTLPAVRTAGA